MENSKYLPEICYKYIPLPLSQISAALKNKISITAKVEKVVPETELVFVRLNDDILATMPFTEASIYSHTKTNLNWLNGQNIRVKVTKITDNHIEVSRKANMKEAFQYLLKCDKTIFHVTHAKYHIAFGDIGAGIKGSIVCRNVARNHVRSVREYINTGDIISAALLGTDEKQFFVVSYKQVFKPYSPDDYIVGATVTGRISEWFKNSNLSGPFVCITPQVYGIIKADQTLPLLKYGMNVKCLITGVGKRGLQLKFLQVL